MTRQWEKLWSWRGRVVVSSDWERDVRERLVGNDDAALAEIYDQYSSFVYGLALRVVGDARAAEDVSQDVFVGLWERPAAFDPDRGSLQHVARNAGAPAGRRLRPPRGSTTPAGGARCGRAR